MMRMEGKKIEYKAKMNSRIMNNGIQTKNQFGASHILQFCCERIL